MLIDSEQRAWHSGISPYFIGAGATVVVVLVRLVYAQITGMEAPFILFQVAVLAAAWQGGLKPGLATTALVMATGFIFQPPDMLPQALALRLGILLTMSVLVSVIAERLHRVGRRAESQKERLRVTLASIGDAVITTDMAGLVIEMNPVAEELTGWANADAKGHTLEEVFRIVNEQTRKAVDNPVQKALATSEVVGLANHTILIAKDGRERFIDDSAAPIFSRDREVVGCVLVFRDISGKRQAEREAEEQSRLNALRAEASASLSGDKDIRGGLQTCTEAIVSKLGVAFARIWTLDEAEGVLILQSSAGLYTHLNGPHGRVNVGEFKIGRIAQNREPHLTNDVQNDPNVSDKEWAKRERMVAFAGYPLMVEEHVVGVAAVFSRSPLSEAVLTDLASLAGVVALYVQRKQAEESLRASEEFNRSLMEGSADCVKVLDLDGRLLHMNAPGLCLLEIDDFAPFCGRMWSGLWPTETAPEVEQAVSSARNGKTVTFQAFSPTPKGTPRWWDVVVSPIRNAQDGRVVRLLSISRDITERKRLENGLEQLNAERLSTARRLAAIVDSSDDAIISKSLAGVIQSWNAAAERLFGYTAEEAVGQHISLLIPADRLAEEDRIITRIRAGEKVEHMDTVRLRKDGQPVQISLTVSPVRNGEGRIVGASKIVRDNTGRKRLEEQLREVAANLSDADRRKNEFLATLAHELRNPLAPIRNALQIVRLAPANVEAVSKAREMMERQLQQMVRLIDDLLEISRISQGKIILQQERAALKSIIEMAVESSQPLINSLGHTLHVEPSREKIMLEGDVTRLSQVFQNLLNNAAKYSEKGGRISVQSQFRDGEAVVTLKDMGIGIPTDMLPKIFDLFTQVDRSLEKSHGGLGIGLSLVKRLVELHGGNVEAQSDGPNLGSTFIVRLPATVERIGEPARVKDEGDMPQKTAYRILIADDNQDSADSLSMLLKLMGNEVQSAYDGVSAVEKADSFGPDVILLDIGMPKLDGYEACRRIRKRSGGREIVLIALTGWGQEEDVRRSQEAGFDHHLVKPVDPATLAKMLGELRQK